MAGRRLAGGGRREPQISGLRTWGLNGTTSSQHGASPRPTSTCAAVAHLAGGGVPAGSPAYQTRVVTSSRPPSLPLRVARGLAGPRVAIVGTRRCSTTGAGVAFELGRDLAAAGVVVVSGLASGIDGAAHRGVLAADGAPPVGVVGSGLDVVYPRGQSSLWRAVAEVGVLISEAPLGAAPERWRFPARNRIIAALVDIVVVVESHRRGGSLHTVDEADRRGRDVLAVPGSIRNPAATGTNELLAEGRAPVCSVDDVLVALGLSGARSAASSDRRMLPVGADQAVLDDVGWQPRRSTSGAARASTGGPGPPLDRSRGGLVGAPGRLVRAGGRRCRPAGAMTADLEQPVTTVTRVAWHLDEFVRSLTAVAPSTVEAYGRDLGSFTVWAERLGLDGPGAVDRQTLRRYLAYMATRGQARRTIARRASALRRYFRWLQRAGHVDHDPTVGLSAPKGDARLPRVLRPDELRDLLGEPGPGVVATSPDAGAATEGAPARDPAKARHRRGRRPARRGVLELLTGGGDSGCNRRGHALDVDDCLPGPGWSGGGRAARAHGAPRDPATVGLRFGWRGAGRPGHRANQPCVFRKRRGRRLTPRDARLHPDRGPETPTPTPCRHTSPTNC